MRVRDNVVVCRERNLNILCFKFKGKKRVIKTELKSGRIAGFSITRANRGQNKVI